MSANAQTAWAGGVTSPLGDGPVYDIGAMLDRGAWSGFQKRAVALAAFAIVLDGFDGQMIGFAIPSMIHDWGLTRGDFAPAVVAGLVGMGFGSAFAGLLADRAGRRTAIITSVLVFAVSTFCIGFSTGVPMLAVFRFLAGLGIGGALPTSTTLSAEFTPARRRVMAVTLTIVCVPLGGAFAGMFSGYVLPEYGWRTLFWGAGLVSLVLASMLLLGLPESPRFLARRPARWLELGRLLGRMGQPVGWNARFADPAEQKTISLTGVAALFEHGRKWDAIGLGATFFMCLFSVYMSFSWLPTLLTSEGLSPAVAGSGLEAYNFGGVAGALICAFSIGRFGSRWPMVFCAAGGALSAFALFGQTNGTVVIVLLAVHGMFVNAVQSTLNALSAHIFPTEIRATGAAFALVCGRFGAIIGGFIGAAVITLAGSVGYFGLLSAAMACGMLTLLIVRHHVPPRTWMM